MKVGTPKRQRFALIQEEAGISMGISANLALAGQHAALTLHEQYQRWLKRDRFHAWGHYKREYFTVAVGGGNTVKAQYRAWLDGFSGRIDWLAHVRFFFLEETAGGSGWESAEHALIMHFIVPLTQKLSKQKGRRSLARTLGLDSSADEDDIIDAAVARLIHPINIAPVTQALELKDRRKALRLARIEAQRYADSIRNKLGASMAFHCICSGIGKDGTLGAFSPYTPELAERQADAVLLKKDTGSLRIALSRGVLVNAEQIYLIVSGTHKLKALGRFEMEEATDFEQTVMETPLRMLRENREIAEKVYIFADEQALHFSETRFQFSERGQAVTIKAETRPGEEENGVHILLLHGFMGLFSFANLLIRLPSAWEVSALHRGSRAKFLENEDIFPHYARALRKAILSNWRKHRPVPIAGQSIAGVISDHLLLSIIGDYEAEIPRYEDLNKENRALVDALRASGIIHLATWSPTDGPNTGANIGSLVSHLRNATDLDYSGLERTYTVGDDGRLQPAHWDKLASSADNLSGLDSFLKRRISRPLINGMTVGLRSLLNNQTVQQRMLNSDMPYVMRLVGGRLLKTASLYGLAKEVNAALHDPVTYQARHLKALDVLLAYDIPFLSIIHQDDFLVSARRHREEHRYLLNARLRKEGVSRESDLRVPARLVILRREHEQLSVDPLNPHLLVMSTSPEGNSMARQITAAMTRFVNENVARAIRRKMLPPLASISSWQRKQKKSRRSRVA